MSKLECSYWQVGWHYQLKCLRVFVVKSFDLSESFESDGLNLSSKGCGW